MARTDGFLTRGIARWRKYTGEPGVNSKYSDNDIIEMLQETYAYVLSEVNRAIGMGRTSYTPIRTYADVTLGDATSDQYYSLPPYIGTLLKVEELDSSSNPVGTLWSRGEYHPYGKGWRIEDNVLWVAKGELEEGHYVRVHYAPSGCAALHEGTLDAVGVAGSGATTTTTNKRLTLANSNLGVFLSAGDVVTLADGAIGNFVVDEVIDDDTVDLVTDPGDHSADTTYTCLTEPGASGSEGTTSNAAQTLTKAGSNLGVDIAVGDVVRIYSATIGGYEVHAVDSITDDDTVHFATAPTDSAGDVDWCVFSVNPGLLTLDTATDISASGAGELDTHPHAYAGSRVRILSATTNDYVQERHIKSYAVATRVATLVEPFSPVPGGATITYEICPVTSQVMDRVIWLLAVLDVLAIEDEPRRYNLIKDRLRNAMRELRLFYGQRDAQSGGKMERSRTRYR